MKHYYGLEVYLVGTEDGRLFTEYTKNELPSATAGNDLDCYIESASGKGFAIVVKANSNFKRRQANALRFDYTIDEGSPSFLTFRLPATKHLPMVLFSKKTKIYKDGDELKSGNLAFSSREIDHKSSLEGEAIDELAESLGKIEVVLSIGKSFHVTRKKGDDTDAGPPSNEAVHVKITGQKGIEHQIKPRDGKKTVQSKEKKKKMRVQKILDGPGPWKFTFRYRNREFLQRAGLMPRTPADESNPSETIDVPTEREKDTQNEVNEVQFLDEKKAVTKADPDHAEEPPTKRSKTSNAQAAVDYDRQKLELELAEARLKEAEARREALELRIGLHRSRDVTIKEEAIKREDNPEGQKEIKRERGCKRDATGTVRESEVISLD